jgi:methenyltetrahydrofolate cyclohydrolase
VDGSGSQQLRLAEILDRLAAPDPTPGAGPALAWMCALAAALVEMANGVTLRSEAADAGQVSARDRDRAVELRGLALALADADAAAYAAVIAARRDGDRDSPERVQRIRRALSEATDPLVAIVELAGELAALGASAAARARGGVRGEALAAARIGAAVARAGVGLVELNLAGAPEDPRFAGVRAAAARAEDECARMASS